MDDEYEFFDVAGHRVVVTHNECSIHFDAYSISGYGQDEIGSFSVPGFGNRCDEWNNFDKADVDFRGSIKWDHCSDWDFCPDNCMMHFCEMSDAAAVLSVVEACYKYAESNLEDWDE